MAGYKGRGLIALLFIVFLFSSVVVAGTAIAATATKDPVDIYAGSEWDNEAQSYQYLGVSTERALRGSDDLSLVPRVFTGRIKYGFKDSGRVLGAESYFLTPSIGLRLNRPRYAVTGYLGLDFRKTERDERFGDGTDKDNDSGLSLQGELYMWDEEQGSLSLIANFSTVDDFFWSRVRVKRGIYNIGKGAHIVAGLEAAAMDNDDFDGLSIGPVVEFLDTSKNLSILLKVGIKDNSAFEGGYYSGVEFYKRF